CANRRHELRQTVSHLQSTVYAGIVRVVTFWNNRPNVPRDGPTTCSISSLSSSATCTALAVPFSHHLNSEGLTHVQLPFPQELPRSPYLGRTPVVVLGRKRTDTGLRPQDPEESPCRLSLHSEIQRHQRSRSVKSLRQTGRLNERFLGSWRQDRKSTRLNSSH